MATTLCRGNDQSQDCNGSTPLFSFGVITDIQYTDRPNGSNFKRDKVRYYRNSLNILSDAVEHWNSSSHKVRFVLQLGDIIDGVNNKQPGESDRALSQTLEIFSRLDCPVYHAVGNHELYNFKRAALHKSALNSCRNADVQSPDGDTGIYYHLSPVPGFRIVILDTFEESVIGHETDSPEYLRTLATFRQYNKNRGTHDPSGISRDHCMYAGYNGAVSHKQLDWLDGVLSEAESNNERVIVAGHVPVCEESSIIQLVCWNYNEIRDVIRRHHKCVVAYLAGHNHSGGFERDDLGISYVTLQGVVDTAPGTSCHATVHVYDDRVEFQGSGIIPSYTLG